MAHFDLAIIGTGSGNSILDERLRRQEGGDLRAGHVRRHLPERRLHSRPRCSSTPPKSPQTVRDSTRFGVDAHLDGVRWGDIVSRVFGRIDPIALGGERYRRSSPNVTVFDSHTRFGPTRPDGRYVLRTEAGEEFTVRSGGDRGRGAGDDSAGDRRLRGSGSTPATPSCASPKLPEHLVIVGGGFVAAEFAHVFSALGLAGDDRRCAARTLLTYCDDDDLRTLHRYRLAQVGGPQPPQRRSAAAPTLPEPRWNSTTAPRCMPTWCWWPPAGSPTATCWTRSSPVSRSTRRARWWSTSTSAPPRAASSRSATSPRTISSSTSPTTRCGWSSTTCCRTGTTPTRWCRPTTATCRRRCSPTRRSPASG